MILVTSASGKTGQHVVARLVSMGHKVRTLSRHIPAAVRENVSPMAGDMQDRAVVARAVDGVDAVIHIGPAFHPAETTMGTSVVDAAASAGTRKFVLMSVIHSQIEDLVNHQSKLKIERHLVHSRMDWTILQPQHYMQNVDVRRAVSTGVLAQPFSEDQVIGHVDLEDVAEVAAKTVTETGHRWAKYELSSNDNLSTRQLACTLSEVSGVAIEPGRISVPEVVKALRERLGREGFDARSASAVHRLFLYYDLFGIIGNGNVMNWLLGRPATTFKEYCRRELADM